MTKKDSYHSRAYHRYFEGYEEREQCNENGSLVIRRFYTGMYYKQDVSDKRRMLIRVLYGLLYTLGVAMFLYAATRQVACNNTWYVTIPSVGSLVSSVLTAVYLFFNITSPRAMQIRSYRDSHERLVTTSAFSAAFMAGTAASSALSLLQKPTAVGATLLCSALYMISGICMLVIFLKEKIMHYLTLESDYPNQVKGSRIRYESDF